MITHEYVDREAGCVVDEQLFGDGIVRLLYHQGREHAPWLLRALTGPRVTSALAWFLFDAPFTPRLLGNERFLRRAGVDRSELLDHPRSLDTPRKLFERKIRYWECRPLAAERWSVVSPCDARVALGSLDPGAALFLKGKFFQLERLLGPTRSWTRAFERGQAAIFRLTPDRYHWNHSPVTGQVVDIYALDGRYHSCNPSATVALATPLSENWRVVTVIDTDLPGGSGVGLVAMVEVAALMIGDIVQAACEREYEDPRRIAPGTWLRRGQPKSLYRPGSSTTVLLFSRGRVRFAEDLLNNVARTEVQSRYSTPFGSPLVETDVRVRSALAECARPFEFSGAEAWW